jgi:hypothetical protein
MLSVTRRWLCASLGRWAGERQIRGLSYGIGGRSPGALVVALLHLHLVRGERHITGTKSVSADQDQLFPSRRPLEARDRQVDATGSVRVVRCSKRRRLHGAGAGGGGAVGRGLWGGIRERSWCHDLGQISPRGALQSPKIHSRGVATEGQHRSDGIGLLLILSGPRHPSSADDTVELHQQIAKASLESMPDPQAPRVRFLSRRQILAAGAPAKPTHAEFREQEISLGLLVDRRETRESLQRLRHVRGAEGSGLSFGSPAGAEE